MTTDTERATEQAETQRREANRELVWGIAIALVIVTATGVVIVTSVVISTALISVLTPPPPQCDCVAHPPAASAPPSGRRLLAALRPSPPLKPQPSEPYPAGTPCAAYCQALADHHQRPRPSVPAG